MTAALAWALGDGGVGNRGALANKVAPKITGVPAVGNYLTVTEGIWRGNPTAYSYQWQDCNARGAACFNISGATSKRYRVASSDTASSIRAIVTAHNFVSSASASGVTGPEPAQFSWISYNGSGLSTKCRLDSLKANRYRIIVLQSNELHAPRYASCLHNASRHVSVIIYVDSIATKPSDTTNAGSCTGYRPADRRALTHPGDVTDDWFLHNVALSSVNSGNVTSSRVRYRGSSGAVLLNVGLSAYWPACASHAVSLARRAGADGIFWDGVICQRDYVGVDASPAYPTDASWQTAENNWASHAAAAVHSTYKLFQIANVAGGRSATCRDPTFRTDIVSNGKLDGSMEESWTDGGVAPPRNPYGPVQQNRYWKGKLTDAIQAEAAGKYYVAHNNYDSCRSNPCGNEAEDTYSLASLLLAANGYSSLATADGQCYSACEAWWPEDDTALELGPATGSYKTLADNGGHAFYERDFANGIVLANPSQHSTGYFSPTPGGTYSGKSCTPANRRAGGEPRPPHHRNHARNPASRNGMYPTTASTCSTLTNVSKVRLSPEQGVILLKTG